MDGGPGFADGVAEACEGGEDCVGVVLRVEEGAAAGSIGCEWRR